MSLIIIFSTIALCLVSVCVFFRYSRKGRLYAKIPGPTSWPLIGNAYKLILPQDKLFLYVRTLQKTYGDVVGFGALDITSINIFNPRDIEIILSSPKFIEKQQPYSFLKNWLGEGLLISNGIKWHQRRKMLTPAFHFNILKKFARTFEEETEVFLENIKFEVGKDSTDIMQLINKMTLRTLCKTAMGTSMSEGIESISKKYLTAIHKLGSVLVQRTCRLWLFIDLTYKLSSVAQIEKSVLKDLHRFTKNIILERKSYLEENSLLLNADNDKEVNKKHRLAMLDLLIRNSNEGRIDDEGIREEVDTFMFRGHDTTSVGLGFLMMRLANEPEVQDKIYAEMERIFGDSDRRATMDDIKEMKYLDCCIKESLRLYPSVYYIARFVEEEVELGGYTVPKDSIVAIHIYDVHHRADLYPDPERFVPERFFPENCVNRHPFSYIPFSAGPRNCIGQKFALLEMKILLASLFRKYRLEPVTKPWDIEFIGDFVLRSKNPMYVRFCSRK